MFSPQAVKVAEGLSPLRLYCCRRQVPTGALFLCYTPAGIGSQRSSSIFVAKRRIHHVRTKCERIIFAHRANTSFAEGIHHFGICSANSNLLLCFQFTGVVCPETAKKARRRPYFPVYALFCVIASTSALVGIMPAAPMREIISEKFWIGIVLFRSIYV